MCVCMHVYKLSDSRHAPEALISDESSAAMPTHTYIYAHTLMCAYMKMNVCICMCVCIHVYRYK